MAQSHREERFNDQFIFSEFDFDESVSLDTTFKNILEMNSKKIGDSIIVIFNPATNANLEYRIYGSLKFATVAPPDADDSWINILRDPTNVDDFDPANYDHNFFRSIPSDKRHYESFTNQWSFVRVFARLLSGSGSCKIWHRGAAGGI